MESVVAAVRVRPMTRPEKDAGHHHAVQIQPDSKQIIVSGERAFTLNNAYSDESTQEQIYNELVNPVVENVMKGFNACVMAYGQTGSGKTFTMGMKPNVSAPGICQRALLKIFERDTDCEVHVSFMEVYKEVVLDLLSEGKKKMHVIDFQPVGLNKVKTSSVARALSVMEDGLRNRHVGATNANLHSSRSHAIFTINYTNKTEDGQRTSKLYLVDLAGSESVGAESGDTRQEGVFINKGLLQLGIVMSALSTAGQEHIPYRNSALTTILKDTLSPQNFVVLIACVSPLTEDSTTTVNSLQFASRVGKIKCNPEAGLIIKPRIPVGTDTPFKMPSNFKTRVNSTIATPGSFKKVNRPALRPLNNTIDSPRTPHVKESKNRNWPTSTPLHKVNKPLFDEPTPIPKRNNAKRRSSSDWNLLDISTSTVVDGVTSQVRAQTECNETGFIQNPQNELWLRSLIGDVIREELKSITLGQTMGQERPSSPKKPRRSARLSKTVLDNSYFVEHDNTAVPAVASVSGEPKALITSSPKVRRSTRLSIAPRPVYFPQNQPVANANSSVRANVTKQSKKAARMSTRLSILPTTTPEDAQQQLNDMVLDTLKNGNVRKLQSLPTIGPKTAVIIMNHRLVHGPIESFKDLENVRGLTKNFTRRFLCANCIVLGESDDSW